MLVRHILPSITESELAAIVTLRLDMSRNRYKFQSSLDGNATYVLDGVHPDDVADVEEELRQLKQHQSSGSGASRGSAKA